MTRIFKDLYGSEFKPITQQTNKFMRDFTLLATSHSQPFKGIHTISKKIEIRPGTKE